MPSALWGPARPGGGPRVAAPTATSLWTAATRRPRTANSCWPRRANRSGSRRITAAAGRDRLSFEGHGWFLRHASERHRVAPGLDLVVDAYPGMTHLLKGELDGTAWDFTLPAAVSCRMEPYPGQGMWRLDLFWLEPRALPAKDGHDPACGYCVRGPDCHRCPPSPRSVGQMSTCTGCALYITSEEMRCVRRSRPSGILSRCSDPAGRDESAARACRPGQVVDQTAGWCAAPERGGETTFDWRSWSGMRSPWRCRK
jgi:hypothetical protein